MNLQQKTELAKELIASTNRIAPITDAHLDQAIADMTNAFLRWPLPESVNADGCATRQGKGRSGTNLMSVGETLTMMQEVVRPIVAQLIADSEAKAVVEIAMVAAESADRNVSLRLERDQLRAERDWLKTWQDQAETNYVIGEPLAKKLRDTEAERDKLRGALALGQQNCDDAYDDLRAERDAARAEVGRLKTERYKYTDDPEMVFTDDFGWLHVIVKEEIDELIARAELAEAELVDQAARFHDEIVSRQGTVRANQELDLKELNQLRDQLATERARLDYLSTRGFEHRHHETGDHLGYEWTISSYSESGDVTLRDVIDAEMREEAK
jgi:regulator of replication initiation timing